MQRSAAQPAAPSRAVVPPQQQQRRAARRQQRRLARALAALATHPQPAGPAVDRLPAKPGPVSYSKEPALRGPCAAGRLRVAVDIDEVLGRFLHSLNQYVREREGFYHDLSDYTAYNFAQVWKCSQEKSNEIVHSFFLSPHFAHGVLPITEASYYLQRMQRCHDLVVVTSRQHCIQDQTRQWLHAHYPHLFREVYFGNHWALSGESRRKSDICREVGASVLIDDNPVYACDCAEAGMEVVLFDWHLEYAWSKLPDGGPLHPRIRRVSDWAAVEEAVSSIAQAAAAR